MTTLLSILDGSGDFTVTWDHDNQEDREKARLEVERLRAAGYSFFLTDGTPADAIAAGAGTLIVRRLDASEVVDPLSTHTPDHPTVAADDQPTEPAKRRRGRPPKADRHVVAVRPLRGG